MQNREPFDQSIIIEVIYGGFSTLLENKTPLQSIKNKYCVDGDGNLIVLLLENSLFGKSEG
ncbi:MAG: hypothetical protein U5K69_28850 [Balneolaceae bacterium]|nr:hypothetical protein [Balneolaceae bacterium]